jgi:hypothetical protein
MKERLVIYDSSITDISVAALMSLLEDFTCMRGPEGPMEGPSIKDLSPLASCPSLKMLNLGCSKGVKDMPPYYLAQLFLRI